MIKTVYVKAIFENGKIEIVSFIIEIPKNEFIEKLAIECNKRQPLQSIEFCTEMEYVGHSIANKCAFRVEMHPN